MILTKSKIYESRMFVLENTYHENLSYENLSYENPKLLHLSLSKNVLRLSLGPFLDKAIQNFNLPLIEYLLYKGAIIGYSQALNIRNKSLRKYMVNKNVEWWQKIVMFD